MRTPRLIPVLTVLGLLLAGCAQAENSATPVTQRPVTEVAATGGIGHPDHIVIVVEENHSYDDVLGAGSQAPYLRSLAAGGATLTQSYGVRHPSQPNYLALFSGSTQGITDDSCPHTFATDNLGNQLRHAGRSFTGYSETQPGAGYTGCRSGAYARKHNPWSDFSNLPGSTNQRLRALPTDYNTLPTVSFVIPNLDHDMHDGTVAAGDTWVKAHLGGYASWAKTHNSLLIVTADEAETDGPNRIATLLSGAGIRAGAVSSQHITHYSLLATLEQAYGLPKLGGAAGTSPITGVYTGA